MINKYCQYCGTLFEAERSSAKFCCNSCKTKANTQRRENEFIEDQKLQRLAFIAQEAENKRIKDEKYLAELRDQNLQLIKQRNQRMQLKRAKDAEKRKEERDKKRKAAEDKFHRKVTGALLLLAFGYKVYKELTKPKDKSKPDDSHMPKLGDNINHKVNDGPAAPNADSQKSVEVSNIPPETDPIPPPDLEDK